MARPWAPPSSRIVDTTEARVRVDERDAVGVRDRDARHVADADAGQRPVRDRGIEPGPRVAGPRVAQDDGRAGRGPGQPRCVVGGIGREDAGEGRCGRARIGHVVDARQERRAAAAGCEIGDPGEVDRAANRPAVEIDRRQPVGRGGDHECPVVGHEQVVDRVVDGRQRLDGRRPDARPADGDRGQVERRDPSVVVADHELVARRVDGQRAGARGGDGRDQLARAQVVGPDLGPGRDVQALAGVLVGRELVDPARLDGDGPDRRLEVARRADVVLAPQDETAGHRVLREVRVRPLVDVVGQPVAPVLEELGRRPRVVDLVEVHLVRLGEPERAQQHRPDHEHDHEEQVELVQPAATLRAKRRAAVGSERHLAQPRLEPADDAQLLERRAWGPGRHGRDGDRGGRRTGRRLERPAAQPGSTGRPLLPAPIRRRGRRPRRTRPRRPGSATIGTWRRRPSSVDASASSSSSRSRARGRSWASVHTKAIPLTSAMTAMIGSERTRLPMPSQSLIPGLA